MRILHCSGQVRNFFDILGIIANEKLLRLAPRFDDPAQATDHELGLTQNRKNSEFTVLC